MTISYGKGSEYPVEKFKENGFAFCSVISKEEAKNTLQQIKDYAHWREEETNTSDDDGDGGNVLLPRGNDRFKIHLFLSEVNRIVHNPILLQAVRQALQTPHIVLWSSDLNIKQANSKQYYSAHQDSTYTGLQPPDQCLTVWIALSPDPVGWEEGCLSFLRGSHKHGQLPHVEEIETTNGTTTNKNNNDSNNTVTNNGNDPSNLLSRGQRVLYNNKTEEREDDDWVYIPLRAGEATMHHFFTIHQSGHNHHPTQARVGLALRYMSQSVRQSGPVREFITWIDGGEDDERRRQERMEKFFEIEPRLPDDPTEEEVKAGRQAHKEAMQREASNYFLDSTNVKGYD